MKPFFWANEMNEDKIQGEIQANAVFIGLLPGVTYTNTHGTVARVHATGGQISVCGIDVGPAYGGEALVRPGDTVLVTEKRGNVYSVFSASMDWPSERKALEAEAFKEIGKWTEITGDKPLSKPIDQADALEKLFEANMKLAKEMTKKYGDLQGTGWKLDCKDFPDDDVCIVPAEAPMVTDRKLRDALLEAGYAPDVAIKRSHDAAHAGLRGPDFCGVKIIEDAQRHSLTRLIGSIVWRFLIVMLIAGVTVVVLAGGRV